MTQSERDSIQSEFLNKKLIFIKDQMNKFEVMKNENFFKIAKQVRMFTKLLVDDKHINKYSIEILVLYEMLWSRMAHDTNVMDAIFLNNLMGSAYEGKLKYITVSMLVEAVEKYKVKYLVGAITKLDDKFIKKLIIKG